MSRSKNQGEEENIKKGILTIYNERVLIVDPKDCLYNANSVSSEVLVDFLYNEC